MEGRIVAYGGGNYFAPLEPSTQDEQRHCHILTIRKPSNGTAAAQPRNVLIGGVANRPTGKRPRFYIERTLGRRPVFKGGGSPIRPSYHDTFTILGHVLERAC